MTREERLKFCAICKKQTKDFRQGIICSNTGERAAFESKCPDFEADDSKLADQAKKEKIYADKSLVGSGYFLFVAGTIILKYGFKWEVFKLKPALLTIPLILIGFYVWTYIRSRKGELWAFALGWTYIALCSLLNLFGIATSFDSMGFLSTLTTLLFLLVAVVIYIQNPFFTKSAWEDTKPFKWSVLNVLYIICAIVILAEPILIFLGIGVKMLG